MDLKHLKAQIDAVLDKRHNERLPKVEESIEFHKELLEKVDVIDIIIHEVRKQMAEGKGRYFDLVMTHNDMLDCLDMINVDALRQKIMDQLDTLKRLKIRFSRSEIQIGLIGYPKNGKRTLIKSISGLREELIPFYNGLECNLMTYAIHNCAKSFHSRITYMNLSEFLSMCRRNLDLFFPDKIFQIKSIEDLTSLNLANPKTTDYRIVSIYQEFISTIIEHISEIATLIGVSTIETSDENIIMDNVAKYSRCCAIQEEDKADQIIPIMTNEGLQWEKKLFKHGIVKDVQVYTSFPIIGDFRVCLIDSESLGSSIDGIFKKEVFQFLEERCDAAIITYRPNMHFGGFPAEYYKFIYDIAHRLQPLQPGGWIYNAIEKVSIGESDNHWNVANVINEINKCLQRYPFKPIAETIGVDFSDPNDVSKRLTIPILETMARNLDDIDSKYASTIKYTNEELYLEFNKIAEMVTKLLGDQEVAEILSTKINIKNNNINDKKIHMSEQNINLLIESILERREKERLPEVKKRIKDLNEVLPKLDDFLELAKQIDREINAQSGVYFTMLSKDPEVLAKFKAIPWESEITEASKKVAETLDELDRLKKRFERPALRIAFVGRERQGKSTFLKTITGLNDKIIPAYSGNSCTGAVSVIHNEHQPKLANGTRVDVLVKVLYYNEGEMLDIINGKLKKFFPSGIYQIGRLDQVSSLQLPSCPENLNDTNIINEFNKFKETTIDHYSDYASLIGTGLQEYHDENEIVQHVAQYEEFDHEEPNTILRQRGDNFYWERPYFKYLAVKNVDIYTAFNIEATEKLELVDTIGIGGSSDSKLIEEEMYRVLKEDCDAAIDLYRPEMTGAVPKEQNEILNQIKKRLQTRQPSKWIGYVINKVLSGDFQNFPGGATTAFETQHKANENNHERPVAWVKLIDGNNFDDVKDNLVVPLLSLISGNLDILDQQLTEKVDELSREAYYKCLAVVKNSSSVISADLATDANTLALFDNKLYPEMFREFARKMNILDVEEYSKRQDEPCPQLAAEYRNVADQIGKMIPKKSELEERFSTGVLLTAPVLFASIIIQIRNDIFTAFENAYTTILVPEQEKVKLDLIKALYDQGLMKNLPVPVKDPSCEWLKSVIDNYVDEKIYPTLRKALEFILEYKINIEGLVEYNVAKSMDIIDPTHKKFIPYQGSAGGSFSEMANDVWQALRKRKDPVRKNLESWIDSFSTIPSHSFYSRVHKFHLKVLSDEKGLEEFRSFYRDNMSLIWTDQIVNAGITHKAFGEWNEKTRALKQSINPTTFNIK